MLSVTTGNSNVLEDAQIKKEDSFENTLRRYIDKLEEVIEKLTELRQSICSHHQKCNIAKTAGAAVSGAGVAMCIGTLVAAPFTGGSSVALGASGAAMSLTGSLSNLVTEYVNYKTTQMVLDELHAIVRSKETFDEKLMNQLDNFGLVIERLMERGLDRETAVIVAVKGIANECIDLTKEPNGEIMTTLSTVAKLHHIESVAAETVPVLGRAVHLFGLTSNAGAAILQSLSRISSVVSVAFAFVDVALVIKDWTSEHPTAEVVLSAERMVSEERQILKDLLEVIESSKGETQEILKKAIKDIEDIEEKSYAFELDYVMVENW